MKKLITCFIFIAFYWAGTALAETDKQIDSLQHLLASEKRAPQRISLLQQIIEARPEDDAIKLVPELLSENEKVKLVDDRPYRMIQQAVQFYNDKKYGQALIAAQQAITLFDKQHRPEEELLSFIKVLYYPLNDPAGRLRYCQQKLLYYQVNGPYQNTAPCYAGIGLYYLEKGAYNQAINYYLKAAQVFRTFSPEMYVNELEVVSGEYADWGNEEKASYYAQEAFNAITPGLKDLLEHYYFIMSDIAANKGDYTDAVKQIDESMNYFPSTPSQLLATTLAIKANLLLDLKKPSEAITVLNRVKAMADSAKYQTVTQYGSMEIAFGFYKYHLLQNNNKLAESALLQAEKDADSRESLLLRLKYLKELGYFYARQNNAVLSTAWFQKYFNLENTYQKSLDEFKVAQYEIDQNDKQQQQHITLLKQEKVLQDYQLSRRDNLLWASVVVLLLISGLLVFIYRQLNTNKKTLATLRQTQTQLIQSEKMASLGELTAGIAHEIQNPLNFVNNFSEVNEEMLEELKAENEKPKAERDEQLETELINDLIDNQKKIKHHGKRADSIVKGMLEHSRTAAGERVPTDINALADEYLRLSYHGLRAKDKGFNAELVTNLDPGVPIANVVPQDISRLLLNLFNNAFYTVNQKKKTAGNNYKPAVSVTTMAEKGNVIIKVKDNGNGIPDAIKHKIMQPFFTTKPTGEGTGLGLSLSYDIVVKGHGGSIKINSVEGEGSEFIILIPTS